MGNKHAAMISPNSVSTSPNSLEQGLKAKAKTCLDLKQLAMISNPVLSRPMSGIEMANPEKSNSPKHKLTINQNTNLESALVEHLAKGISADPAKTDLSKHAQALQAKNA